MPAFLITGNPGSGKTTLAHELGRRGLTSIDPDDDPELSFWQDETGNSISTAHAPKVPDAQWLTTHRWVWSRSRLQAVLSEHQAPVFVCGIALNIHQVLDLFERMFLLRIDAQTQEDRLLAFDRSHAVGRSEAGNQLIREGRPVFETQMLELGAIPLDGAASTEVIADQLLALISV